MSLPYYLNRASLMEHAIVRGASGSGKTATILTPLTEQLIAHAGAKQDSSILILDLKGDPAFFNGARERAKACGLPFRFVTLTRNKASHAMNPFLQSHFRDHMTVSQGSAMLVKSMGLDMGNIYGASYFRDMAQLLMRSILKFDDVDSFERLNQYATKKPEMLDLDSGVRKDTSHLAATLGDLADLEPINATHRTSSREVMESMIDISELLSKPQVVYFYLTSTLQPQLCDCVSKLAAFLLLTAAAVRNEKQDKKVFMVVDEFQRVVSQEFCIFLQQARSLGIGCILANQTTADLETEAGDFTGVIEESTNVKIDLTANSSKEMLRLVLESPEIVAYTQTLGGEESPISLGEKAERSLNTNDILRISSKQDLGIIRVRNAIGYTQLSGSQNIFKTLYHIPKHVFHQRTNTPWPSDLPGTVSNAGAAKNANANAKHRTQRKVKKSGFAERARKAQEKQDGGDAI